MKTRATSLDCIKLIVRYEKDNETILGSSWRVYFKVGGITRSKDFYIGVGTYEKSWNEAIEFSKLACRELVEKNDSSLPPKIPKDLSIYYKNKSKDPLIKKRHVLPYGIALCPAVPGASSYAWSVSYTDKKTGKVSSVSINISKYGYESAWIAALEKKSKETGEDLSYYEKNIPPCPAFVKKTLCSENVDTDFIRSILPYKKAGIVLFKKGLNTAFGIAKTRFDPDAKEGSYKYFNISTYGYKGAWKLARDFLIENGAAEKDVPKAPLPLTDKENEYIEELNYSIFLTSNKKSGTAWFSVGGENGIHSFNIKRLGYEGAWYGARNFLINNGRDPKRIPFYPPPIDDYCAEVIRNQEEKNKEKIKEKSRLRSKMAIF